VDDARFHEHANVHLASGDCLQQKFADDEDLVRLVMDYYPETIHQIVNGQLPIHVAAACPYKPKGILFSEWVLRNRFHCNSANVAIADPLELLLSHSSSATDIDSRGRLALHIALRGVRTWQIGVKQLVETYPDSLC
jgi:hypothetical protein